MSPVSLTLDLLLAALLLITLGFGMRLDKRLKTLQASQADFAASVAELDQAAARAEHGLADLRTAMDEAVDLLAGRIEKARDLATKLEALTQQGAVIAERSPVPAAQAAPARRSALDRVWARSGARQPPADPAKAAETLALTLTREDVIAPRRAAPAAPNPRSRAAVDDELFDGPALRRFAGGRP